jgi:hypothetical protein
MPHCGSSKIELHVAGTEDKAALTSNAISLSSTTLQQR